MARPWVSIEKVKTAEGELELRQRGERDFLITVGGRVLMNSVAHRSEVALGTQAVSAVTAREGMRVMVGGLGMALTLRATLDALPADARVIVVELTQAVVNWCKGPLGPLTDFAVNDPRVVVEVANVAKIITRTAEGDHRKRYDAIIIDLYVGPDAGTKPQDPLYGVGAVQRARKALRVGGVFAIWSENYDPAFVERLEKARFEVRAQRPGKGGLRHVVYLARAVE